MAAAATGEAESGPLRFQFDRLVKLTFQGSSISSDGGLLLHRELDDVLGLTDLAADLIGRSAQRLERPSSSRRPLPSVDLLAARGPYLLNCVCLADSVRNLSPLRAILDGYRVATTAHKL
ncbi:MAG: transposase [Rhodobacteraceae bacterium]|nr:transposase [Paracoccaceae bacterium]